MLYEFVLYCVVHVHANHVLKWIIFTIILLSFPFWGNLLKLAFGWNFTYVHMSGLHFPKILTLFGRLLIIANLAIAFLFILIGFASGAFWSLNFKIRKHSSKFEKNCRFLYICSYGCIPQLYYVSR